MWRVHLCVGLGSGSRITGIVGWRLLTFISDLPRDGRTAMPRFRVTSVCVQCPHAKDRVRIDSNTDKKVSENRHSLTFDSLIPCSASQTVLCWPVDGGVTCQTSTNRRDLVVAFGTFRSHDHVIPRSILGSWPGCASVPDGLHRPKPVASPGSGFKLWLSPSVIVV